MGIRLRYLAAACSACLLIAGCNGQLVYERVVTSTPDPNSIVITVTPAINGPSVTDTAPATIAPTATTASVPPTPSVALPATQDVVVSTPTGLSATLGPLGTDPSIPTTLPPTLSAFPTETRQTIYIAQQSFERGIAFWIQSRRIFWVLVVTDPSNPNVGEWRIYPDTFQEGVDQEDPSIVAPGEQQFVPQRGFGKIWRNVPGLRDALGWALTPEFALNTDYVYQPGGYLKPEGSYVQGPGKHFITTLYKEIYALSEGDTNGLARWQRIK